MNQLHKVNDRSKSVVSPTGADFSPIELSKNHHPWPTTSLTLNGFSKVALCWVVLCITNCRNFPIEYLKYHIRFLSIHKTKLGQSSDLTQLQRTQTPPSPAHSLLLGKIEGVGLSLNLIYLSVVWGEPSINDPVGCAARQIVIHRYLQQSCPDCASLALDDQCG